MTEVTEFAKRNQQNSESISLPISLSNETLKYSRPK